MTYGIAAVTLLVALLGAWWLAKPRIFDQSQAKLRKTKNRQLERFTRTDALTSDLPPRRKKAISFGTR